MTLPNGELNARLDLMIDKIDVLRQETEREGEKRDTRIRTNRILNGFAFVLVVVAIFIALAGIRAQDNASASSHDARIASCNQYNMQQHAQAQAERSEFGALDAAFRAAVAANPPGTAEEAARTAAFFRDLDTRIARAVVAGHQQRDCTPEGIKKFLTPTRTTE